MTDLPFDFIADPAARAWRDNIARPAGRHPHLTLAAAIALGGMLRAVLDLPPFIVHLWGRNHAELGWCREVALSLNSRYPAEVLPWPREAASIEALPITRRWDVDAFYVAAGTPHERVRQAMSALVTPAAGTTDRHHTGFILSTGGAPIAPDFGRSLHPRGMPCAVDIELETLPGYRPTAPADRLALMLALTENYATVLVHWLRALKECVEQLRPANTMGDVPQDAKARAEAAAPLLVLMNAADHATALGLTGWSVPTVTHMIAQVYVRAVKQYDNRPPKPKPGGYN